MGPDVNEAPSHVVRSLVDGGPACGHHVRNGRNLYGAADCGEANSARSIAQRGRNMPDEFASGEQRRGVGLAAGAHHYRAYVGLPERYDTLAVLQFKVLTDLGLREHHTVLDVGCGSLRLGRLLLPYLLPDRYVGVEP